MHTYPHLYASQRERVISGAGAFGMHLLFLALLVLGVNWQKKVEPQPNVVDLWANLPPQAQPKVEPPPPPPPPQPVAKPKPEPVPPPKPVAKAEVAKPDIAMKDKAIKEKAEAERRALEEKQKAAKKREEEARAAAHKQEQARQAEAQRLAKEQEEAQRKLAEQAAAARQGQVEKYKAAIRDKIRRFIVLPPNLQGNPESEFDVIQLPGGEILEVRLKRPSGNAAYDSAVERAIRRAQPLPLPTEPSLFQRELNLTFRAQDK